MTKPPRPIIVSDDLPEAYVRLLYGDRIDRDVPIFSRTDAVRQGEAERHRSPKKDHHPHGHPRRERAAR
jgi:hypothetical protein